MPRLLLHDYNETELKNTIALLRASLRRADVNIEGSTSRNEHLRVLSELPTGQPKALALIDLRKNESSDMEFAGLRIIETIARHPDLRLRAIPVILTRHRYNEIQTLVSGSGARAAIEKRALEDGSDVQLFLDEIAADIEASEDVRWLPERPRETDTVAAVFGTLFPGLPMNEKRLAILHLDMRARTDKQIAAETGLGKEAVRKNLNLMRRCAHPRFVDGDTASLAEASQELFESAPQAVAIAAALIAKVQGPQPNLERIPSPTRIRPLWENQRVVRNAWLDPRAREVITSAMSMDIKRWRDAVLVLGKDRDSQGESARAVARGVFALVDADSDVRSHPSRGLS